jgi:hypothetical protein
MKKISGDRVLTIVELSLLRIRDRYAPEHPAIAAALDAVSWEISKLARDARKEKCKHCG